MKTEAFSKFFKISLAIFLIALILVIAAAISFNNYLGGIEKGVRDFTSTNSDDYWEYSIARFNKAGDFHNGFRYLDKAVALEPLKHLGYRGWIRLRKLRDYDKALLDFDRLDALTPNTVDAPWGEDINFLRGECYFGKKDHARAIAAFNAGIEHLGRDWVDVHSFVYLGLCHLEMGNTTQAISEFQYALEQYPQTCEAHFGLARTYLSLGQREKAEEHLALAEENLIYKRDDHYNEFLNEIYWGDIAQLKKKLSVP
ncbi:tetratricopeptide repeat protein [Maribacter sp. 2307ULW6-5]|uniref:tetratricopeptide repeat protein n=1 Tax=Maribacter sp. 2307ULW6-5 TaxID=3386275 RepID=UPI0039BD69B4